MTVRSDGFVTASFSALRYPSNAASRTVDRSPAPSAASTSADAAMPDAGPGTVALPGECRATVAPVLDGVRTTRALIAASRNARTLDNMRSLGQGDETTLELREFPRRVSQCFHHLRRRL